MKLFGNITAYLQGNSNSAKVAKNIYWALLGKIVSILNSLLVGVMVARYLGAEQYGLMNYVVSFVTLFQVLASFGLDNIEIREEARNTESANAIIGTSFTLRLIFAVFVMVLIVVAAYINKNDTNSLILIFLYSFTVLLSSFDVIRNYFTSIIVNEYVVKVGIVSTILACVIKVILILLHASLIWFIFTLVIDALFYAIGYCVSYHHKVGSIKEWSFDIGMSYFLLKQSFPLLLSGAAATVFLRIDQVMLGDMLNKSAVGYFSVASKFVELLIFIPTILIQTVSPLLIRVKKNSVEEYYKKAQQFLNLTVWSCLIASVIFSLSSYYLVVGLFGDDYLNSVPVLKVLSFKIIAVALNVISGQIMIIDNNQKWFVVRSLSGCILCIILNYFVIPVYGTMGVAWVAILTQLVAGFFIHLFIPQYQYVFKMQVKCLLGGWRDIVNIKSIVKQ